jgi:hypothetical protein
MLLETCHLRSGHQTRTKEPQSHSSWPVNVLILGVLVDKPP